MDKPAQVSSAPITSASLTTKPSDEKPIETKIERIKRFGRIAEFSSFSAFLFIIIAASVLGFSVQEKVFLYIIGVIALVFGVVHHFFFYRYASPKLALLETLFGILLIPVFIYFSGGIHSRFVFLYFSPLVLSVLVFGVKELIINATVTIIMLFLTFYFQLQGELFTPENLGLAAVQSASILAMAFFTYLMSRELLAERQAKERLQELTSLKDEFIAIGSHYLRTPITSIRGYLSLLQTNQWGSLNEQQSEAVDHSQANLQRLQMMVEELLSISTIQSGEIKIYKQDLDVKSEITNVLKNYSPIAIDKNLTLTANLPATFPNIKGDREKLNEAIGALIDNAIKFTKQGGVKLSLADAGENIQITVADTGIGMSEKVQDQLFQKFHRGTDYLTLEYQGMGLGLYICKLIVQAHGGRIEVTSKEDQGSTFTMYLPKV